MIARRQFVKHINALINQPLVFKPVFLVLGVLILSFFLNPVSAQEKTIQTSTSKAYALKKTSGTKSKFSSPFTSYFPVDTQSDPEYWRNLLKEKALKTKQYTQKVQYFDLDTPIEFDDVEPNNNLAEANLLNGLGSSTADNSAAIITGRFGATNNEGHEPKPLGPFPEDDGDINKAPVITVSPGIVTEVLGTIDANSVPFFCDIDMVSFTATTTSSIDIRANATDGQLDPMLWVYDEDGTLIINNDDFQGLNSGLTLFTQEGQIYYVAVSGYSSSLFDPFDSSSCGSSFASSGDYILTFSSTVTDIDIFSLDLRAGDVLGVSLNLGTFSETGMITLKDQDGNFIESSESDFSFIYPADSPMPGGGNVSIAFTVPQSNLYHIELSGMEGDYETNVVVVRPANEILNLDPVLFLDFDGESIDANAIFATGLSNATLSPLSAFLENWGLTSENENALIDQIISVVRENLIEDLKTYSFNPEHNIIIRNSRDHEDTFGSPGVSRIIVGGTIDETDITTIGLAQSIDPGNFDLEETAIVLLDVLSGNEFSPSSLNSFKQEGASTEDIIALVAEGVGNIIAHEAGHFYGSFHTRINDFPGIMDQGGDLPGTVGVGEDGLFNTEDDQDVDFITDTYNIGLGRIGEQDTLNIMAAGLLTNLPPVLINTSFVEVLSGETLVIPITLFDLNSENSDIELSAISSDESLLPNDQIEIIRDEEITLQLSPNTEFSGIANVTIIAEDGFFTAESDIAVTVISPNQAPIIGAVENTSAVSGTPITLILNISDDTTALSDLHIAVTSSNESLLNAENLEVLRTPASDTAQQAALFISPENGEQGIVSLTITVSDGSLRSETTFDMELDIPNEPPVIQVPTEVSGIVGSSFIIPFSVLDAHSDNSELNISVESLATNVLSNSDIQLDLDGSSPTITLNPKNTVPVEAIIRLSISDEEFTTVQEITLFIDVPNTAPDINSPESIAIHAGESGVVQINITDIHTPVNDLDIEVTFGNELLSSSTGLVWNSDFSQASLTLELDESADEDTIVVITVSDGELSTTQTIQVDVQPLPERSTGGGGAFSLYTLLCFALFIAFQRCLIRWVFPNTRGVTMRQTEGKKTRFH